MHKYQGSPQEKKKKIEGMAGGRGLGGVSDHIIV